MTLTDSDYFTNAALQWSGQIVAPFAEIYWPGVLAAPNNMNTIWSVSNAAICASLAFGNDVDADDSFLFPIARKKAPAFGGEERGGWCSAYVFVQ